MDTGDILGLALSVGFANALEIHGGDAGSVYIGKILVELHRNADYPQD